MWSAVVLAGHVAVREAPLFFDVRGKMALRVFFVADGDADAPLPKALDDPTAM